MSSKPYNAGKPHGKRTVGHILHSEENRVVYRTAEIAEIRATWRMQATASSPRSGLGSMKRHPSPAAQARIDAMVRAGLAIKGELPESFQANNPPGMAHGVKVALVPAL